MSNCSSWSDLPAELLQHILSKIENKGFLLQCQLVCKGWQKPAQRIAYHTVHLTKYYPQLTKLVDTLQSSEHLGKLVNTFNFNKTFYRSNQPWDPEGYFEKLSNYCPNVQAMTTGHRCNSLWLRLLTENDKWEKLQQIPEPYSEDDTQLYMATAFAFNDRLTNVSLVLNPPISRNPFIELKTRMNLLTDLSTFKNLKNLDIRKPNGIKLEELDGFLDSCSKLVSLTVLRLFEAEEDNTDRSTDRRRRSALPEKLLEPKTGLKKLNFSIPNNINGDETLNYIMRVLPNLKQLYVNTEVDENSDIQSTSYSAPVLGSFLQYGLGRENFAIHHITCNDIGSALSVYFQSEAFKATKKKNKCHLMIKGDCRDGSSPLTKPSIKINGTVQLTVDYSTLEGTSTPFELIEKVGPHLYELNLFLTTQDTTDITEETKAMYQGYFLDHVFEHCTSLKNLYCSFRPLISCNPELSISTSIEFLCLSYSNITPASLYQLSIRLPNLKRMSFIENDLIAYNGNAMKGKKLVINMPYTNFNRIEIEQRRPTKFSRFFIKYSNEDGDLYYYSALIPAFTKLLECPVAYYTSHLDDKSSYFLQLRCQAIRDLVIVFDESILAFNQ